MSKTSRRRALLLAVPAFVGLLGCPTPAQYGGPIAVDTAGLEARTRLLCRAHRGPPTDVCPADARAR